METVRYLVCGCKVTFGGLGVVRCAAHWLIQNIEELNAPTEN